jgi:hypothetical protein
VHKLDRFAVLCNFIHENHGKVWHTTVICKNEKVLNILSLICSITNQDEGQGGFGCFNETTHKIETSTLALEVLFSCL